MILDNTIEDEEGGFQSEPEIIFNRNDDDEVKEEEEIAEASEDKAASEEDGDDEEEETSTGCPICLEPWTNSGRHRLCSLRCGHLFGRQCIDRWLAGGRVKCPQCNAPAKRADIRVLYCKRLVALDTAERDRLEARIATQQLECRRLEEALAQANLSAQLLRAELESVREDSARSKKRRGLFGTGPSQRSPFKFLRRSILGSGASFQCRTVAFDSHHGIFLVSRSEGERIGGVVKVSLWDASGSEFVALHDGPVRAIATSPHGDGLFLTCGADDRLRLSTMTGNSVLQTWKLTSSPWSCAFHPGSINHVLVGLSSGQIAMYDLRLPDESLPVIFQCPQKSSNYPVHSIHIIPKTDSDFLLLGATMEGPFALKLPLDPSSVDSDFVAWSSDFGYKGFACTSLSLDPVGRSRFLASYRSVPPREASRHVIFEFAVDLELKLPLIEFRSIGEAPHKTPFRSSIIDGLECFIPEEASFSGQCYQLSSSGQPQIEVLTTNAGIPVLETCVGRVMNKTINDQEDPEQTLVLGLLTSKHLYIYTTTTTTTTTTTA